MYQTSLISVFRKKLKTRKMQTNDCLSVCFLWTYVKNQIFKKTENAKNANK